MDLAALLLLAPAIYAAIGLGSLRLVGAHRERVELAPLVGLVVSGWVPQIALLLGGVPYFVGTALAALAVFALVGLRDLSRPRVVGALLRLYFCYGMGVLVLAIAAVPALGLWGTDWAMYVRAGQALLDYAGDPRAFEAVPELIAARPRLFAARPHLFSAAVAPLAPWLTPLVALEVLSAVAGASLLLSLSFFARRLGRPEPTLLWLAFFSSLPLYAYHLLALWPKFLLTGALLAAMAEAYAYRASGRWPDAAAAWIWMGFALAAHHAAALYLPLLLLVFGPRVLRERSRMVLVAVFALLATVGVYETWALWKLGLSARIESNPSIHQASSFEPVYLAWKTLRQLFGSIVGTGLPYVIRQLWAAVSEPLTGSLGHLHYAVSGWLVFLAGTFVGNLLPVWVAARRELVGVWRAARESALFGPVALGLGVALVGASVLAPIVHLSAAQLGSMPTCVALVYFASSSLPRAALRRAFGVSLLLGTLPLALDLIATRLAFGRALAGERAWLDWFLRFEADTRLLFSLEVPTLSQSVGPLAALALVLGVAVSGWLAARAAGGR